MDTIIGTKKDKYTTKWTYQFFLIGFIK